MYTYAQRYVTDTVSVLMSVNLLHTVRAFCWCKNNHSWPEKKNMFNRPIIHNFYPDFSTK